MGRPGLREYKKRKTRTALLDAALELFLARGYEQTTVEQIADAVDVSPRTFFRYFASKEDLAFDHMVELERLLVGHLSARPGDEPPFTALFTAYRLAVREMKNVSRADTERYLKIRRLLDATPALLSRAIARTAETERRLTALLAEREGVDPATDPRPALAVALVTSAFRVGFECWDGIASMDDLVARVEATLDLAERALSSGWED